MIVTVVVVETARVVKNAVPAKPFAGIVTVAGTGTTAGLLLVSDTTAPPSGAPTLSTAVTVDSSPPTTVSGCVDIVESVAGGGASCGVKLRTADHAPAAPFRLTPRTR